MVYQKMLEKIVAPNELQKFAVYEDDEELLEKFIRNGICLTLDWKQEDVEGVLVDFIQERSRIMFGEHFSADRTVTAFYQNHYSNRKNGDLLEFMLKIYNEQLREINECLLILNCYDDQYRIFVVKRQDARKLTRIKSDFWKFSNVV